MAYDYMSGLFGSSYNQSQNSSMFNAFSFSDYNSIRNGSYGKLLKSYYAQNKANVPSVSANKTAAATKRQEISEAAKNKDPLRFKKSYVSQSTAYSKNSKNVFSDLTSLTKSTSAVQNSDLYELKTQTTKDANGVETTKPGFDMDGIYNAVKNFAKDYNSLLTDSAENQKNWNFSTALNSMKKITADNSDALAKVGVSVGIDGSLTVSDEKMKTATAEDFKSVFSGKGSYADQVDDTYKGINSAAVLSASYATSGSLFDAAI